MVKVSFWKYFSWLLLIDFIFTLGDAIFHLSFEALEVYSYPIPQSFLFISANPLFWYVVGKFVATIIFGSLLFYFVRKGKNDFSRSLILTIPVVLLMEIRYLIGGAYGTEWHILNTIMHFGVLLIASYLVFRYSRLFTKK